MKIAIFCFDEPHIVLDNLPLLHNEIIDANIYIFTSIDLKSNFENNKLINEINIIKNKSLIDIKNSIQTLRYHAKFTKFDIAVDTTNDILSTFFTYIVAGRTAGVAKNGLINNLISLFYDEKVISKSELFTKPFGIEITNDRL
jgi:ADP-heptose:LPS heptosyltransferase